MSAKRQPSISVETVLNEMGLNTQVLQETVIAGEKARNGAHRLDPKGAAGHNAYQLRIRTLRLLLLQLGWTVHDELGCAMVISPEGERRIVVARGNGATGRQPLPTTHYKKGAVWRRAVEGNQLELPGLELTPNLTTLETVEASETWVLLVWHEERKDMASMKKYVTVRSELSLPDEWHEDDTDEPRGRPSGWKERLILPELVLEFPIEDDESDDVGNNDGGDDGDSDDLDVPLKRTKK